MKKFSTFIKEKLSVELDEGYRIHATSKDGEKMKSGIHSTAKAAQDMHYKMAKSGMYKKIEVVKESLEAVELDEATLDLGFKTKLSVDKDGGITIVSNDSVAGRQIAIL